jgi:hypothetical protein
VQSTTILSVKSPAASTRRDRSTDLHH